MQKVLGKSLKLEFLQENLEIICETIVCRSRVDKETNMSERINVLGKRKLTFHDCVCLKCWILLFPPDG